MVAGLIGANGAIVLEPAPVVCKGEPVIVIIQHLQDKDSVVKGGQLKFNGATLTLALWTAVGLPGQIGRSVTDCAREHKYALGLVPSLLRPMVVNLAVVTRSKTDHATNQNAGGPCGRLGVPVPRLAEVVSPRRLARAKTHLVLVKQRRPGHAKYNNAPNKDEASRMERTCVNGKKSEI